MMKNIFCIDCGTYEHIVVNGYDPICVDCLFERECKDSINKTISMGNCKKCDNSSLLNKNHLCFDCFLEDIDDFH